MPPLLVTLAAAAGWVVDPIVPLILARRERAGKEDPHRITERLGRPGKARPDGPLVWLHAASVGEVTAALPIIEALLTRHRGLTVLVTTGTLTSARLLEGRLPDRSLHQFVPVDIPRRLARFLDHWRPDAALFIEQEWWPNTLTALRRRHIPTGLLSARLTDKTVRNWQAWPRGIQRLLDTFKVIIPGGAAMAQRLQRLGVPKERIATEANLKFAASPVDHADTREALLAAIGRRPVWTALSVHIAELPHIITAMEAVRREYPTALLLLAPRKPQEMQAVAEGLHQAGLTFGRRSAGDLPGATEPVYLIDTLGEAGMALRATPAAFIGGSLEPGPGGHNVLEPLACGAVPLYGPHMENFADIAAALEGAKGAIRVTDGAALGAEINRLLAGPDAVAPLLQQGEAVLGQEQATVVQRTVTALFPVLAAVPGWQGERP